MRYFNKEELQLLTNVLDEEIVQRWESLINRMESDSKVVIANTGLFSSGKSMMFNALLDTVENERFRVGATPTTRKGDKELFEQGIEIMDTPGINANDADDTEAFQSLLEADIIIITHNVKTGMLDKYEHDWIKRIAEKMQKEELKKRLIFVCTWVDESGTKEDRQKKVDEIKRQLAQILGTEIVFMEVSSKRYYAGKQKNNEKLCKASNIPELKTKLIEMAEEYRSVSSGFFGEEYKTLYKETEVRLRDLHSQNVQIIAKQEQESEKKFNAKKGIWSDSLNRFDANRKEVEVMIKELENEGVTI